MQKRFSIAEAKNKLPSIIHDVEKGNAVELTRRGKPVAALLSIKEYERLCGKNQAFWSGLMAVRQVWGSRQLLEMLTAVEYARKKLERLDIL